MASALWLILLQFDHFTIWKRDGLFKEEREVKKIKWESFFFNLNVTGLSFFFNFDWDKELSKDMEFPQAISDS